MSAAVLAVVVLAGFAAPARAASCVPAVEDVAVGTASVGDPGPPFWFSIPLTALVLAVRVWPRKGA